MLPAGVPLRHVFVRGLEGPVGPGRAGSRQLAPAPGTASASPAGPGYRRPAARRRGKTTSRKARTSGSGGANVWNGIR